jgi:hypothetical protein
MTNTALDRKFLTVLALRVLAVYVMIQSLAQLFNAWVSLTTAARMAGQIGEHPELLVYLATPIVPFALGLVVMIFAPEFAARILGSLSTEESSQPFTPASLEIVGYRLLGMYLLMGAVPAFGGEVLGTLFGDLARTQYLFPYGGLILSIFRIGLGLLLLLGARKIAAWVEGVRGAGLPRSS